MFLREESANVFAATDETDPAGTVLGTNLTTPPAAPAPVADPLGPLGAIADPGPTPPVAPTQVIDPNAGVPPTAFGAPRTPVPATRDPCAAGLNAAAGRACRKLHPRRIPTAPRPRPVARPKVVNICKTPGLHPQCIPAGRRIKATTLGRLPGQKAPKFTIIGTNTGLAGAVDPLGQYDQIDDAGGQFDDDTDTTEFDTAGYSERGYEIPDAVDGYLNTNRVDITMS